VLRRAVRGAGWWLLANALAWMLGMPIIFPGARTIGSRASGPEQLALIRLAIVASGAVVGAGAAHPPRRRMRRSWPVFQGYRIPTEKDLPEAENRPLSDLERACAAERKPFCSDGEMVETAARRLRARNRALAVHNWLS